MCFLFQVLQVVYKNVVVEEEEEEVVEVEVEVEV
jgi:hypothetical protein